MFIFQKRLLQEQKNRTISLTNIDFGHRAKKQNNLPSMSNVYVSERKCYCFASVQFTWIHRPQNHSASKVHVMAKKHLSERKCFFILQLSFFLQINVDLGL